MTTDNLQLFIDKEIKRIILLPTYTIIKCKNAIIPLFNGKLHGLVTIFSPNGDKYQRYHYTNGTKEWAQYYKNNKSDYIEIGGLKFKKKVRFSNS